MVVEVAHGWIATNFHPWRERSWDALKKVMGRNRGGRREVHWKSHRGLLLDPSPLGGSRRQPLVLDGRWS